MKPWWIELARYARPQVGGLLLIGLFMLCGIGLNLLTPWPMKLLIDHVFDGQSLPAGLWWLERLPGGASKQGLLFWLAASTVGLFVLQRVMNILQAYVKSGVGSRMTYGLAADTFDVLQRRSLIYHRQQRVGDLIRRVTTDTGCVKELVLDVYLPLLTALITVGMMATVMWKLNSWIAALALLLTLPLALVIKLFAGPMSKRKYEEWQAQGDVSSLLEQNLSAIPLVQAFGREGIEDSKFRHATGRSVRANLHSELSQHQFQLATGTVNAIGTATVMLIGAYSILAGEMSVGSLVVLITYFAALYSPIESLAYLSEGFASAGGGARRVFEVLRADDVTIVDAPDAMALAANRSSSGRAVQFVNVGFGYQPGRPVLRDLSLAIPAGQTLALVGATGAGKSTLVSLVPRLFDPWTGEVKIDGRDIRQLQLTSVRDSVAIVPQEPFLLPLSIADNIAYARPVASREEVVAAAVAARADAFIQRLPQGYDTVIGERGVTLSGGERQRLSIARALLKDAPILILDEPTSSLDAQTEAELIEAMATLMEGRTTIIIAHRLSTIRHADRIAVMEDGRIVEQGTHDELLSMQGSYSRLHNPRSHMPSADLAAPACSPGSQTTQESAAS